MKKLMLLASCFLMATNVQAQIVDLACPAVSQLNIKSIGAEQYSIDGPIQILSGVFPIFPLIAMSSAASINFFTGAKYIRDRGNHLYQYQCEYHGRDYLNEVVKVTLHSAAIFGLEYCFMPQSSTNQCDSNDTASCRIKCEML